MIAEAHHIAARLAAVGLFPVPHGDWDSRADVTAEGDVITVVVTDHLERAKREYRAVIHLVASTPPTGGTNG